MTDSNRRRNVPLEMDSETFRELGYQLIDRVAAFLDSLPGRPVSPSASPDEIRKRIGVERRLPEKGSSAENLLSNAADLLFDLSLFNGHPRFWGYVTSSAAPIGALADLLAAAVNPNVGAWKLSPAATEIELQTVRWVAELIGYPEDSTGLLVSGGNMANFVGFLTARHAKTSPLQDQDSNTPGTPLAVYASRETHTWIEKAVELFGPGMVTLRWIDTDNRQRIDLADLESQIQADLDAGLLSFLVVGNAGTVSTGAIDPLEELATICRRYDLWFHVDGAYGALAAAVPEVEGQFRGMAQADSIAVDPHKWLYAPLEAGCALVRDGEALRSTFSHRPSYYHLEEAEVNFFEFGLQNSRGFRALKVWLGLCQAGREGFSRMISDDIQLARELYRLVDKHPDLEALSQNLSITTFRYKPHRLNDQSSQGVSEYLDDLNGELLTRLENSGEVFLSNALVEDKFALRVCIVNFRTSLSDIQRLPEIVLRLGREVEQDLDSNVSHASDSMK